VEGSNYPWRGGKGATTRGGVSVTAMVHSSLIPSNMQGQSYGGLMHITDWLPTLMHIATDGQWTGSLTNAELDGLDMWEAILTNATSPRIEIVHYADGNKTVTLQQSNMKFAVIGAISRTTTPVYTFASDLMPQSQRYQCSDASLMDSATDKDTSSTRVVFWRWLLKHLTYQSMATSLASNYKILVLGMLALIVTATIAMVVIFSKMFFDRRLRNRNRAIDNSINKSEYFPQQVSAAEAEVATLISRSKPRTSGRRYADGYSKASSLSVDSNPDWYL
jgi:hypothetical protein